MLTETCKKENRIGEWISEMCGEKNLTYYALARTAGVPLTTLMHIVDGSTKNPGIYTLIRVCSALEQPMSELIDELSE